MATEVQFIVSQLRDAYEGDPWFGRCIKALLLEVDEVSAFQRPNGQHSILDLVWHMVTWREFVINRLERNDSRPLHYFEENDWRRLDYADRTLWKKGLDALDHSQQQLLSCLENMEDHLLSEKVPERTYDFRKLLYGTIQHDIYHAGQIAYLKKLLS
jgi:uncharacterized damage-inducible protein DinB